MKLKNVVWTVAGIGGTLLAGALLKKGLSPTSVKVVQEVIPEPEQYYKGVPLSKLDELAKQIYHGLHCTIDQWGFLVFHYKSNRGHTILHPQMTLDETGKLINLGGHYPGQWWSGADEFAKKANEIFTFKK